MVNWKTSTIPREGAGPIGGRVGLVPPRRKQSQSAGSPEVMRVNLRSVPSQRLLFWQRNRSLQTRSDNVVGEVRQTRKAGNLDILQHHAPGIF